MRNRLLQLNRTVLNVWIKKQKAVPLDIIIEKFYTIKLCKEGGEPKNECTFSSGYESQDSRFQL